MFKSCCARSGKKVSKDKSHAVDNMESKNSELETAPKSIPVEHVQAAADESKLNDNITKDCSKNNSQLLKGNVKAENVIENWEKQNSGSAETSNENLVSEDDVTLPLEGSIAVPKHKRDMLKKRFSIDYKPSRIDFKRYSVDLRHDSAALEELNRLEQELARTNMDVRPPGRRKSVGILKSTTSYTDIEEKRTSSKAESCSEDDEVFDEGEAEPREPPATPVGRDELALRRHRFFSDLVCAARAAVEHRVRFDPLGPVVADSDMSHEAFLSSVNTIVVLWRLYLGRSSLNLSTNDQEAILKAYRNCHIGQLSNVKFPRQRSQWKAKIYDGAELEELLEEDSSQTQKELVLTLEVTQQAVSHRLKSLGMVHKKLGVVYYELLNPRETITGTLYRTQLMRLSRALKEKRPQYYSRHDKIILLHDNARPHVAVPVKNYLKTLDWEVLPHPPYSPDIAPSDYHLLRSMAHALSEQRYTSYEDIGLIRG
ncbi:Mariner Mos1 transposase [Eumeta japonica]|uniref:Mariner Mos1 transposase n=1 Tax=Eumeta variegata TaxID=151549 RepID=A0A4C1YK22_EUMVA|nr:Mariner Mos1 transposase [Eumeta japonica]